MAARLTWSTVYQPPWPLASVRLTCSSPDIALHYKKVLHDAPGLPLNMPSCFQGIKLRHKVPKEVVTCGPHQQNRDVGIFGYMVSSTKCFSISQDMSGPHASRGQNGGAVRSARLIRDLRASRHNMSTLVKHLVVGCVLK